MREVADTLISPSAVGSEALVIERRAPAEVADERSALRQTLLDGPIVRTLVRLALPTLIVILAQTAVNVVEAFYIGFLGTDALAGVALVFPAYMLMTMMSAGGIGSGVGSAVSRAIGAGHRTDADAIVLHGIVLSVVAGAAFAAAVFLMGDTYFRSLGGRGGALTSALTYSRALFVSAIAVWLVNVLSAALRASGNVKVPAAVSFIGALVTIPISPALIFGFGPIPRLGIAGAGTAFSLYNTVAALVLLRYLLLQRGSLRLVWAPLKLRLFAAILKVGLPAALNTVQANLTVILVTAAVGFFGTSALAAYGVASRLDYILIPILFGISSAVMTMVGVNVGAGQIARAKRITWVGVAIGAGIAESIGVVVAIVPNLWLHLFSHDLQVVAPAATYLHIVAPAYGLFGLGFVITFAAQGAGHVLWPTIGSTSRLLVAAAFGWIAVTQMGARMPLLSAIVSASLASYALFCGYAMVSKRVWQTPSS